LLGQAYLPKREQGSHASAVLEGSSLLALPQASVSPLPALLFFSFFFLLLLFSLSSLFF
jgi:hypothetical protein